jgi:hypothetical protein
LCTMELFNLQDSEDVLNSKHQHHFVDSFQVD